MRPPDNSAELTDFGWQIAEATLATAPSEHTLVTHWFLTPDDTGVNADDHFGSDERTLRFLSVALPTLIDQLDAAVAVVVLPWGLDGRQPTLTVIGVGFGEPAQVESRALRRVRATAGPPYWRLEPGPVEPPSDLAAVTARLVA